MNMLMELQATIYDNVEFMMSDYEMSESEAIKKLDQILNSSDFFDFVREHI